MKVRVLSRCGRQPTDENAASERSRVETVVVQHIHVVVKHPGSADVLPYPGDIPLFPRAEYLEDLVIAVRIAEHPIGNKDIDLVSSRCQSATPILLSLRIG